MNQVIKLKSRPQGEPTQDNFEFSEIEMPTPEDGEVLLKSKYVSVDPYLRGRMNEGKSYIPAFEVGQPMASHLVAEVVESKNDQFEKGEFVHGALPWKRFQTSTGKGLTKIDKDTAPLSAYLGVLGLTGMTAYFGLEYIGKPKKGETLLVSGASGAVGSTVGQIGKLLGCRVVGIAGTDDKIQLMREKFGFDEGINYKTTDDISQAIKKACPDGVDVYFDNVGGETLDAAIKHMNRQGRIVNCGAISTYNAEEMPTGPRHEGALIRNSLLMQGFTVGDFRDKFGEAVTQLTDWLQEDKLTYSETIVEGFENIPQAFMDLFAGKNEGKMVVKVY